MKKSWFIEGVILGAIVGGLAGVLLAPASGEETRERLRKLKDDNELLKDAKDKTEVMIAKTMDAIEKGFEKVTDMVDERRHPIARQQRHDLN